MGLGFGCLVLKQQGYLCISGGFWKLLEAKEGGVPKRTRLDLSSPFGGLLSLEEYYDGSLVFQHFVNFIPT
jgi:hypothetical protein